MIRLPSLGRRTALISAAGLAFGCELLGPLHPLPDGGSSSEGGVIDTGSGGDAEDGSGDGPPPGPTCDTSMPFGEPMLVYGLNRDPGTEFTVRLSPDELTAYVAEGPGNYLTTDLYSASRGHRSDAFRPLVPLTSLNEVWADESATVTGDGLVLFMDSTRAGSDDKIYRSSRTDISQQFSTPELVMLEAGMIAEQGSPYVLPDGSALYFGSYRNGTSSIRRFDLTAANVAGNESTPLSTVGNYPVVSGDELTLYFGCGDDPNIDICVTSRPSRDDAFQAVTSVAELNTTGDEYPQWISPDGCRLYFIRQVGGTLTYSFVAERTRM